MTLNKHQLDGDGGFSQRTMAVEKFEAKLKSAGYSFLGSGQAKGGRHKIWWTHSSYRRIEAIYSDDKTTVITAYHPG